MPIAMILKDLAPNYRFKSIGEAMGYPTHHPQKLILEAGVPLPVFIDGTAAG